MVRLAGGPALVTGVWQTAVRMRLVCHAVVLQSDTTVPIERRSTSLKNIAVAAISRLGSSAFGVLPFLITFGFGGYLAISGSLTFGRLAALINVMNQVANPLGSLPRRSPVSPRLPAPLNACSTRWTRPPSARMELLWLSIPLNLGLCCRMSTLALTRISC